MNITEGSANNWLNVASYNNNTNNTNTNGNITSSNNNQSIPSPQLWDLRWFALLSGPLLFGTIIIPLITGPAIRYLCRSYVTLRVYWRFGFVLLAIAYPVLFHSLASVRKDDERVGGTMPQAVLECINVVSLTLFVLYQVSSAFWLKRRRWLWNFGAFLVTMVQVLGFLLIRSGKYIGPYGYFGWIVILIILHIGYRREAIAKRRADIRAS